MCPPEPTRRSEVRNKICALLYPLYGQCSLDVIVQKHLTFTFRNVFLLLLQGEMTLFKHRIGDKPKKIINKDPKRQCGEQTFPTQTIDTEIIILLLFFFYIHA